MNRRRRKKLKAAFGLLRQANDILSEVKTEEQKSYDNLPETFQSGEQGEEMESCIELMEEISMYFEDAASVFEQI